MFDKKSKELYSGRFVTTLIINKMCIVNEKFIIIPDNESVREGRFCQQNASKRNLL